MISKVMYHIESACARLLTLAFGQKNTDYGYHVIDTGDTEDYLPYENIWGMIEKN
jgi:hypothetical protein